MEDSEAANLPAEAFVRYREYQALEIDNRWIHNADDDEKRDALRAWFHARFRNPSCETPYNGREGGFLYVHGGPYDPADVLPERFQKLVAADLIQEVVDELHHETGDAWAPIEYGPPDDYDDLFDLPNFSRADEPLSRLRQRVGEARLVLSLTGDAAARRLVEKLAFGAAISALESFLWETVTSWVTVDDNVLKDFVTKLPQFRDESITLGQIYDRKEGLRQHVLAYLQNIVWHRWDIVMPLFTVGLGIKLDSVRPFVDAMVKRHDIVHRFGHDRTGQAISIDADEVCQLCDQIEKFALATQSKLTSKFVEF